MSTLIPPIIPFPPPPNRFFFFFLVPNFLFTRVQLGIAILRRGKLEIQCEEDGGATQRGEPFRWGHKKKPQIHQRSAIPKDNEQDDTHGSVSHRVFSFLCGFFFSVFFFPFFVNQKVFELLLFGAHQGSGITWIPLQPAGAKKHGDC